MIRHSIKLLAGACMLASGVQAFADITCTVTPKTVWNTGYKLDVIVKNTGPTAVANWAVNLNFREAPLVTSSWNGVFTTSGLVVKATNLSWNGVLGVNATTPIGLTGNHDGTFIIPTCSNANGSSSSSSSSSSASSSSSSSSGRTSSSSSSSSGRTSSSSSSSSGRTSSSSSSSSGRTSSSSSSSSGRTSSSSSSSSGRTSSSSSSSSTSASSSSSSSTSGGVVVNVDRSLLVHDSATMSQFTLTNVMNQLATQMNAINTAAPITGIQLFGRMWAQQQPAASGGNCTGSVNNWPVECRFAEGNQAVTPANDILLYRPIGLVNRFDLRDPVNFNDCGEYRVVFGRTDGLRNFIIFEAQVPNPTPGIAGGCRPIQQFWQGLTAQNDPAARGLALRNFFFNGLPAANVRAPIDIRNFADGTGQIRTNQFLNFPWVLKEYKTTTTGGVSTLKVVSDKANPVQTLFNANNTDPRASVFQADFVQNLGSLLNPNLAAFNLIVAKDVHNAGESQAGPPQNDFLSEFNANSVNSAFDTSLRNRLAVLNNPAAPLSVAQVLNRAAAMTCGGCHLPGAYGLTQPGAVGPNQAWPDSLGFVHISEFADVTTGIFPLSPALRDVFLPARKADMESFLNIPATQAPIVAPPPGNDNRILTGKRSG